MINLMGTRRRERTPEELARGARIAARAADLGLTGVYVATMCGVSSTTYYAWVRGIDPSVKHRKLLAQVLRSSESYLMDGVPEVSAMHKNDDQREMLDTIYASLSRADRDKLVSYAAYLRSLSDDDDHSPEPATKPHISR
jgi:transcriptional regulator with XRE-family HTH domain